MIEATAGASALAYAEDAPSGLVGTIGYTVKDEHDVTAIARTTSGIVEVVAGSGVYQATFVVPLTPGPYVFVWDTGGMTPVYSTELMQVTPGTAYVPAGSITSVSDLTDLAVLVPWGRRACEGPYGPPQGKATLADSTVYPMLADAASEIILFSGNLFGQQLNVTGRDPVMGYPVQWKTDRVLTQWEGAVIICQVALDYWRFLFRDMQISGSIKNEGTEYEWAISANVIRDYLKVLQTERDRALVGLQLHHPVLDRYASNIRVRDQATVTLLEWWSSETTSMGGGLPGGQEAAVIPWTAGWSGGWGP